MRTVPPPVAPLASRVAPASAMFAPVTVTAPPRPVVEDTSITDPGPRLTSPVAATVTLPGDGLRRAPPSRTCPSAATTACVAETRPVMETLWLITCRAAAAVSSTDPLSATICPPAWTSAPPPDGPPFTPSPGRKLISPSPVRSRVKAVPAPSATLP